MALDAGPAFQVLIGFALLAFAALLFALGRRRPESITLATFLALVAVNFLALATTTMTGDRRWIVVSFAALALDPFYLLAFVTLYPYKARPPRVRALLALAAVLAAASLATTLLWPSRVTLDGPAANAFAWEHLLPIGALVLGYSAAWLLAVRAAQEAPTPRLARQAAWLAAAVGVAVLPRMALLPADLAFRPTLDIGLRNVLVLTTGFVGPAVLFAAGWLAARRASQDLRRTLLRTGALAAGLVVAGVLLDLPGAPALTFVFPLRWIVFSAMLVYGMLAYEVLEFERARDRVLPVFGGLVGGVAVGFAVAVLVGAAGVPDPVALALGLAAALGAAAPAGLATRAVGRALGGGMVAGSQAERRLELYRAALESAWARGPPGPEQRAQLERERRAFGVSGEEARALEHVVAAELGREGPRRLRPGDEPATGLVLDAVLGEGAHGRVFAARRYPSGERVVVKEFHADVMGAQASRARLLDEFRALRELDHPRIVRPLEVQAEKGRHLLVMQYVDATPLSERLARGPLAPEEVRAVLLDVLDALGAAHDKGIVHRDVKPSNILLGPEGAWLTDFGVARTDSEDLRATVSGLTAHGGFAGTVAYMAPEQARGERAGPAADLYAAGLVAFEALTGKPAVDLRGRTLYQALGVVADPDLDLRPVPPAWREVLLRALQPVPSRRFRSAHDMRRAVLGVAARRGRGKAA